MDAATLAGGFSDAPIDAARAFRAAMNAMARPGQIVEIPGASPPEPLSKAAGALILTLCDSETVIHLAGAHDTPAIRAWIAFHTGAPVGSAEAADFAVGTWDALAPVTRFRIGTPDYPDRSATLMVEVDTLEAAGTALSGPGIKDVAHLHLPDPAVFDRNSALYPLGWDAYLTRGAQAAGLPRSTRIG